MSWEHVNDDDAPLIRWVPDHMATQCFSCKVEFWVARRKHHCRSCGQVFCNECTGQMAPIPSQNLITAERVCLPCYVRLTGKSSPSRDSMTESGGTISGSGAGGQGGGGGVSGQNCTDKTIAVGLDLPHRRREGDLLHQQHFVVAQNGVLPSTKATKISSQECSTD